MSDKKGFKLANYTEIKTIGTGSFGRVKLMKHKRKDVYCAVKMLKKNRICEQRQIDHVYCEYVILSEIKHPLIVNMTGMDQDDKMLYFKMEYVPGGELFSLMRKLVTVPLEQAKFYIAQVVQAIDFLHSKSIIYRDLKPENILINSNGYIKITDFGFAKRIYGKTYTLCGTPEYMAPEIILNKGHTMPVDWWSLGVLLYEMIVGVDPFNDNDPMMVYTRIIDGKYKFPRGLDKYAKDFIKQCLVANINWRLACSPAGISEVYCHRLFKKFDWKSLSLMTLPALFIPNLKNLGDATFFGEYPESDDEKPATSILPDNDPFLEW